MSPGVTLMPRMPFKPSDVRCDDSPVQFEGCVLNPAADVPRALNWDLKTRALGR